ncbi:hypothetical protein [Pseudomonas mediterranea]|jgi:hypothetical protein|uniref:hypothetical protein n=1 Tax=Pseudomonas mediterranea TaxID=183795 RepID=UPI00128F07A6|nr:hypothetical protein [Pseudomonas mediterranea]MDU9028140.1 hypothetical protein [Pseudomonas mediterranea]
MLDDLKVPSLIFKKLCIFGVVLIACQGKLFPLCYSCEALNNPRDWQVEEGSGSGFLSCRPVNISHHAGKKPFRGGLQGFPVSAKVNFPLRLTVRTDV